MGLDTAFFRERLLARRAEIDEEERLSEADRETVTLDKDSVGRLSRIDAMQVQAMALAQQRRRQVERQAIDSAWQRIAAGEYGYCVACGEAIAAARLEHNPAVPTCIGCARERKG